MKLVAFDLGAETGRVILGRFDGEKLSLEEVHRFPNEPVRVLNTLHWDVLRLFHEMKKGLAACIQKYGGDVAGMGVDTWGVDFGLLGPGDELLSNPYHYRDHFTDGIMEEAFHLMPREEIFNRTGIQFIKFNTIFQLLAMARRNSALLKMAETLLLMPNLFNFFFTGRKVTEFSIATTTQVYDPVEGNWSGHILEAFGIPSRIFTEIISPGTVVGPILPMVAREVGASKEILAIAPAGHDTGSAVAAVPAKGGDHVYLSSGTWSLMGVEVRQPLINDKTFTLNFTNEGGVCGTFRLLKNIMGLWLVQECRRAWERAGETLTYEELMQLAGEARPLVSLVDPDDDAFMSPVDMPEDIRSYCRRTGQPVPEEKGALIRCILDSLALKYRWVVDKLEEMLCRKFSIIHVVGGGIRNHLLCQLTADATGLPVAAGPVEATAIGNLLMQCMALGEIGSLDEAREIVRASFPVETYEPRDESRWGEAYGKFLELVDRHL